MSISMSARVAPDIAEHLRRIARQEDRTVSEIMHRALDEYVRQERFPGIRIVRTAAGVSKAVLPSGRSVWGVVMAARGLAMNGEETAACLGAPLPEVRLALAYYTAYPEEIDRHLQEIDAFAQDPARFVPSIGILEHTSVEAPAG